MATDYGAAHQAVGNAGPFDPALAYAVRPATVDAETYEGGTVVHSLTTTFDAYDAYNGLESKTTCAWSTDCRTDRQEWHFDQLAWYGRLDGAWRHDSLGLVVDAYKYSYIGLYDLSMVERLLVDNAGNAFCTEGSEVPQDLECADPTARWVPIRHTIVIDAIGNRTQEYDAESHRTTWQYDADFLARPYVCDEPAFASHAPLLRPVREPRPRIGYGQRRVAHVGLRRPRTPRRDVSPVPVGRAAAGEPGAFQGAALLQHR